MQGSDIQISTRVDAKLRDEFDNARLSRGRKKLNEAVSEAIRLWIDEGVSDESGKSASTAIPADAVDTRETYGIARHDLHRMLDQVLESDAHSLVIAIVTNLLVFGHDAESLGVRMPQKESTRYRNYENRLLKAVAKLCDEGDDQQLIKDLAAFLAEADPPTKEIVVEQIDLWKIEKAQQQKLNPPKAAPAHDPPKEEPRTRPHSRRKAV